MTKARENSDYTGLAADITAGDTAARAGRKNWIINGDFQISQRGAYSSATSITASPVYYLDRFNAKHNNISGTTVRQTNQTVNGKVTNTMMLTATAGSNGRVEAVQIIEDEVFNSQTVIVSAWVISNSASARLVIHQSGANIQTSSNAHTGGGAYELLKATVTCASNAGKLHIYTGIQAAGTGNVAIANGHYFKMGFLQLELGSVATDFEHRSYGEELALCQRYCHVFQNGSTEAHLGVGAQYNTTAVNIALHLPNSLRASPTAERVLDGSSKWLQIYVGGASQSSNSVPEVSDFNGNTIRLYCPSSITNRTAGEASWCHVKPNAKLILSAEL